VATIFFVGLSVTAALQIKPACGVYVHIPFCETKCGYCDFYSVPLQGRNTGLPVERVCRELRARVLESGHRVRTIFFGGGTPTLLPVAQLDELFRAVAETAPPETLDEFTVEANPATVDGQKAALLVRSGVTRVSMGAQSFFPAELAALERLHSPDDIPPSVATLRANGVRQINVDLIFGIPGQSMASWAESLRRAIGLGVDHLACYGLTYEPNTRLTGQRDRGLITPCDEQIEADMYLLAIDLLVAAGFEQYEISNFAKPGCRCRHNLIYWRNEPYIGVGPSAAGCVHNRRYKNVPDVARYVRWMDGQGHAELESETLDSGALALEMILMQLRLNEGLCLADFERRTGQNLRLQTSGCLDRLVREGLLNVSDTHVALTRAGRLVANTVMAELAAALDTSSSVSTAEQIRAG